MRNQENRKNKEYSSVRYFAVIASLALAGTAFYCFRNQDRARVGSLGADYLNMMQYASQGAMIPANTLAEKLSRMSSPSVRADIAESGSSFALDELRIFDNAAKRVLKAETVKELEELPILLTEAENSKELTPP